MKIITDTNLLLRAIIADDPGAALAARQRIQASSIVTIPTIVICEFVWVAMRAYKSPRHAVAKAIRDLVFDPKVVCDRDAVEAGLAMLDRGGDFANGVIAFEGRRLGGRVLSTYNGRPQPWSRHRATPSICCPPPHERRPTEADRHRVGTGSSPR